MKSVLWRQAEEFGVVYTEDREHLRRLLSMDRFPVKRETVPNCPGRGSTSGRSWTPPQREQPHAVAFGNRGPMLMGGLREP